MYKINDGDNIMHNNASMMQITEDEENARRFPSLCTNCTHQMIQEQRLSVAFYDISTPDWQWDQYKSTTKLFIKDLQEPLKSMDRYTNELGRCCHHYHLSTEMVRRSVCKFGSVTRTNKLTLEFDKIVVCDGIEQHIEGTKKYSNYCNAF